MNTEQHFLDLDAWYHTPLGQVVAAAIQEQLATVLPQLYGYQIVQLGLTEQRNWLASSPIARPLYVSEKRDADNVALVSRYQQLPFANASVDVMFLPHSLAYCQQPERMMAEIDRVLLPEGHVIIIGFNPLSWWGLAKAIFATSGEAPWTGHYFSTFRLTQFLHDHGYQTDAVTDFFYRPPITDPKWLERFLFLETTGKLVWPYPGGLYLLHAKKQTRSMTRIRPLLSFRNIVVGKRYIQPSANQVHK